MKKKQTILIVPPRGVPLKAFRIRLAVVVILAVIAFIGFTGFFVPIKTITNNVAEQNQRKNLTEQNKALLQKIISSLRMLQNVKTQISQLETKKINMSGINSEQLSDGDTGTDTIDFSKMKFNELMTYTNKIDAFFGPFGKLATGNGNIFDTIPVLYPVSQPYHISRKFGSVFDPFSGKERFHYGTDFVGETGTPVYATASGIVKRIEQHTFWGNRVTIQHSGSYSTVYAHLGVVMVSTGKRIKRGDIIGAIGLSGLTSGPHVHYEIIRDGIQVDPADYFFPVELFAEY